MELANLTPEKFNEIYTNKEFRNKCCNAYSSCDSYHKHKFFATGTYPVRYIISEEQIAIAKELRKTQKIETLEKYNSSDFDNVLVMVSMGWPIDLTKEKGNKDKYIENLRKSDVGNYRVRANFKTSKGSYFVEFSTCRKNYLYCTFSIIYEGGVEKYHYKNLDNKTTTLEYTKENILNFVNHNFDANFKSMVLDEYDISTDDFFSRSL